MATSIVVTTITMSVLLLMSSNRKPCEVSYRCRGFDPLSRDVWPRTDRLLASGGQRDYRTGTGRSDEHPPANYILRVQPPVLAESVCAGSVLMNTELEPSETSNRDLCRYLSGKKF